jgi:lipopolysaccharide export system permease protein
VKLLDKLVFRELIGPWIFGVFMFTVMLMAGTYLFRLTDMVVRGVPISSVLMLSIDYLPGLMVKTFPMSTLLASLLAFGRLSNDSEVIATMAGGASILQMMRPVVVFGFLVSGATIAINEILVPPSSMQAMALYSNITKSLKGFGSETFYLPIRSGGKFLGSISARDVDVATGAMTDVTGTWFGDRQKPQFIFFGDEMRYTDENRWEISHGTVFHLDPDRLISESFDHAMPNGFDVNFSPKDVTTLKLQDADAMPMRDLGRQIVSLKNKAVQSEGDRRKLLDLQVSYWTKLTLPLSGLVFALVGAPAGIRRSRQSVGVGVALSITITFVYYLLHNYMTIIAKGGLVMPVVSAFTPLILGLIVAYMLIRNKNG